MCDAGTFLEVFGICISQNNAVSGAVVAALASLGTTAWKLWFDYRLKTD